VTRILPGLAVLLASTLGAQQATRTEPVTGLRANATGFHALVGARVVTAPGQVLDNATIVIRNGLITAVGAGVAAPAGARVWDLKGLTVYPGFIDAHADLGTDAVPQGGDVGPTHWNPQVRAWFSTTANLKDDSTRRAGLRSLGFGTALAVPRQGIFRGTASVLSLADGGVRDRVLRPDLVQTVGFQRSFQLGGMYPNSAMGTVALMKQTFMDAEWYTRAWAAYERSGRSILPPETSEALAALNGAELLFVPVTTVARTRPWWELLLGMGGLVALRDLETGAQVLVDPESAATRTWELGQDRRRQERQKAFVRLGLETLYFDTAHHADTDERHQCRAAREDGVGIALRQC
jgi:hypothetical protein